jgi:hypothetical protein
MTISSHLTDEQRLSIYTPDSWRLSHPIVIDHELADSNKVLLANPGDDFDAFWEGLFCYQAGLDWQQRFPNKDIAFKKWELYLRPINDSYRRLTRRTKFLVKAFDNRTGYDVPVFVKSCNISERGSNRFILPLEYSRHFKPAFDVPKYDCDFNHKKSMVLWRGVTTGSFSKARGYSSRYHLARLLVQDSLDASLFDVGFNDIVQLKPSNSDLPIGEIRSKCIKPKASMQEHLGFKYLLSLEGNDVASGLKWMLSSNSLVLMPVPEVETWACESLLVPYVHYVPVASDLHDLSERVDWCENHPGECLAIVKNSSSFMHGFSDPIRERLLADEVVNRYCQSVGAT